MIRIEVKSADVNPRNVPIKNGPRAGQIATFREQTAWAHLFDRNGQPLPYPVQMTLTLEDNAQPYPPGHYTISPASFYVNRFRGLELGRPVLVPAQAVAKAA